MRDDDNEMMPDVPDSTLTRGQARDLLEQNAAHRSPNATFDAVAWLRIVAKTWPSPNADMAADEIESMTSFLTNMGLAEAYEQFREMEVANG